MSRPSLQPRRAAKSIAGVALMLSLALGLASPAAPAEAPGSAVAAASMTVTFVGVKTPSGAIMISLAGSAEAWDGKVQPAARSRITLGGAAASATFTGLKPGLYAIRAFHDLNGDGKLNANPFGMPTEPYAFSNNAQGVMGPPPWAAAAFRVKAGDNRQTIDID